MPQTKPAAQIRALLFNKLWPEVIMLRLTPCLLAVWKLLDHANSLDRTEEDLSSECKGKARLRFLCYHAEAACGLLVQNKLPNLRHSTACDGPLKPLVQLSKVLDFLGPAITNISAMPLIAGARLSSLVRKQSYVHSRVLCSRGAPSVQTRSTSLEYFSRSASEQTRNECHKLLQLMWAKDCGSCFKVDDANVWLSCESGLPLQQVYRPDMSKLRGQLCHLDPCKGMSALAVSQSNCVCKSCIDVLHHQCKSRMRLRCVNGVHHDPASLCAMMSPRARDMLRPVCWKLHCYLRMEAECERSAYPFEWPGYMPFWAKTRWL